MNKQVKKFVIYKNNKRICIQYELSVKKALEQYINSWLNSGYNINPKEYTAREAIVYEDYIPLENEIYIDKYKY